MNASYLETMGYLNKDAPDLRDLEGKVDQDVPATYCSGSCWRYGHGVKGKLVHLGEFLKRCPKCGSKSLLHDRMPKIKADKLRTHH